MVSFLTAFPMFCLRVCLPFPLPPLPSPPFLPPSVFFPVFLHSLAGCMYIMGSVLFFSYIRKHDCNPSWDEMFIFELPPACTDSDPGEGEYEIKVELLHRDQWGKEVVIGCSTVTQDMVLGGAKVVCCCSKSGVSVLVAVVALALACRVLSNC